ncbi:hypothetical protein C8Q73DRAFT_663159 [Cubamyces lactineus]|nr:hypothetical protein C8Q73DRAFT_663159 [Cubamyces lactineus]
MAELAKQMCATVHTLWGLLRVLPDSDSERRARRRRRYRTARRRRQRQAAGSSQAALPATSRMDVDGPGETHHRPTATAETTGATIQPLGIVQGRGTGQSLGVDEEDALYGGEELPLGALDQYWQRIEVGDGGEEGGPLRRSGEHVNDQPTILAECVRNVFGGTSA